MLNLVALAGNLTRDPQLSYTSGNMAICEFGIAVNEKRKGADKTHFINCKAFGKTAEFVNQYFKKGKAILIVGKLDYSEWDKDGQKRSKIEVIANDVQFVGGKDDGERPAPAARPARQPARQAPPPQDGPNVPPAGEDDPLPF